MRNLLSSEQLFFKTSPAINIEDTTGGIIATNGYNGKTIKGPNEATRLLHYCRQARTQDELASFPKHVLLNLLKDFFILNNSSFQQIVKNLFQSVDMEIAGTCNARCVFCPRDELETGRGVGIMRKDVLFSIGEKLLPYTDVFGFAGIGEPTLNRNLIPFFSFLKQHHKSIMLVTNASLLSDKLTEQIVELVDSIQVSFNGGDPRAYNRRMVGLDYSKSLENLQRLVANAKGRCVVSISAVIAEENSADLLDLRSFWKKKGVHVELVQSHSRGNLVHNERVQRSGADMPEKCGLLSTRAFIAWDGTVHSCCHDIDGKAAIGSLVSQSVAEIAYGKLEAMGGKWWKICAGCDELAKEIPVHTKYEVPSRRITNMSGPQIDFRQ